VRLRNSSLTVSPGGQLGRCRFPDLGEIENTGSGSEKVNMRMYYEFCEDPSFLYNLEQFSEFTQFNQRTIKIHKKLELWLARPLFSEVLISVPRRP